MNGVTSLVVAAVTVVSLAFGGLQYATNAIKHLIPNVPSLNFKAPSSGTAAKAATAAAKSKTSTVPPVVATGGKKAGRLARFKKFVGSPLGKAGAVGAGVAVSETVVPLQMNDSGKCYTETMNGIQHVPCNEAKKSSK